jgi:glutathione synthase/RimK-type ligase-like ATP-grasp enzyme
MISAKWLSDPYAIEKSENKFLQLSIAQRTGLSIPKTLITTNKETLRNFINRNNKSIIKPISQGRILYPENNEKLIFTNVLSTDLIDSLHEYELTPAIFQEFVEKDYEIRVTVVGTSIFAARINSQADEQSRIDWRRKRLTFEKYSLPKHIEEKCIKMMCELRINFAAFDFIRTPSGEYVFLELNPNGQWVWIEQDTKLKISDAIIKYLS